MLGFNHWELMIFLFIVLLLFGGKRIPGIARSLGKSITEFKKGIAGTDDEAAKDEVQPTSSTKAED
jgi:sec-independent protein translocase protein TatA